MNRINMYHCYSPLHHFVQYREESLVNVTDTRLSHRSDERLILPKVRTGHFFLKLETFFVCVMVKANNESQGEPLPFSQL